MKTCTTEKRNGRPRIHREKGEILKTSATVCPALITLAGKALEVTERSWKHCGQGRWNGRRCPNTYRQSKNCLSPAKRVRVFKTVLLYSAETWRTTEKAQRHSSSTA
ncbi:Uncharacterised protein r2_g2415 [Pycnogonum litorale]